uniref:C2 domain-containing protein n=1 Tax=Castor canadensis TaxID=51338 RepID=A0A8C0W909_CASCN
MSHPCKFNGYLRVRIGEAVGLQPTRWSLRHSLFKKGYQLLDPYLTVSVDQVRVGQTSTKQKTNKPTYNEEFCANVTDGGHLELAVFHETPLGYDHFVANCTLQFQELLRTAGTSDTFEGWVSSGDLSALCPLNLFSSIFRNSPGSRFPNAPQRREFPPDFGPFPGGPGTGDATAVGVYGRRCVSRKPAWTWSPFRGRLWLTGSWTFLLLDFGLRRPNSEPRVNTQERQGRGDMKMT